MPVEVDFIKPSHASLTVTEKLEESALANASNPSTGLLSLPFPALEAVFSTAGAFLSPALATGWLSGLVDVGICLYCPIAPLRFRGLTFRETVLLGMGGIPCLARQLICGSSGVIVPSANGGTVARF